MSRYRKVVWNEGMLITPHHFQQWDNYHEDQLNSRLGALAPYEWGVIDLQVNRESVANGFFELTACHAIMPDGLIVNVGQIEPVPESRPIQRQFDTRLDVYLAVPARRAGGPAFQMNGGEADPTIRYLQQAGRVMDETTGDNEQQLAFARGNLRVLFANEMRDGYSAIKIAQIERTATGQFALAADYVPPLLKVTASVWLNNLLRQLIEILTTKSSVLGDQRRQQGSSLVEFNTAEVGVFWLLHTVNAAIPGLAHLFRTDLVHPERLYFEMARLAGALMTFASDKHPKDIVVYDHDDLYTTFSKLAAEIRELLEFVIPTKCVPIPLVEIRKTLYQGRVQDDRLLKEAAFYLGVHAQTPEGQLIERVPLIVKIAANDEIEEVVAYAMPGVELRHASPPPAPIPRPPGFHYFGLDSVGPFWEHIRGSKTVSVYVPDEFRDVKVEMYAIKP